MKPSGIVQEELRLTLFKMDRFRSKSQNQGLDFLDVLEIDRFLPEANTASKPSKFYANSGFPSPSNAKQIGFLAPGGPR